jgi:hypothetical protein
VALRFKAKPTVQTTPVAIGARGTGVTGSFLLHECQLIQYSADSDERMLGLINGYFEGTMDVDDNTDDPATTLHYTSDLRAKFQVVTEFDCQGNPSLCQDMETKRAQGKDR